MDSQKVATEEFGKFGWSVIWGKPQPIRPGTTKSVMDAKQGGVGIAFRSCHSAAPSPRSSIGEKLYDSGRWQSVSVKFCKSGELIHVVSVYGFPRANEGGQPMIDNEELMEDVLLEAASLGAGPVVVCGDFNVKVENSHALSNALSSGAWTDAAAMYARAMDREPEPTYFTPQGLCSRIDLCLLNAASTRALLHCEVVAVPLEGIKRHKPVEVQLRINMEKEFAFRTIPIRGLPKFQSAMDPTDLQELAQTTAEKHEGYFYDAYAERNIDLMWSSWCRMAEDYLLEKVAVESCENKILHDSRYRGRGFASTVQQVRVDKIPDRELTITIDEDRRTLQKLVNLLKEIPSSPTPDLLWSKVQRLGPNVLSSKEFKQAWDSPDRPDQDALTKLTEAVTMVLYKVTWGDRERLLRRWKIRKLNKGANSFGDVARHFRDADQAPLTVIKTPSGQITGRIKEMDQILRDSWLSIFAKHRDTENCPYPSTEWFMRRYADHIPYVPQELEQLTLEDLQRTLGKMSSEGAGGLDGWTPRDFKQLHPLILEFLLVLYDAIEESGTWPSNLCWAGVTLIPKGEGGAPLEQRPITVTPIAYRVWAASRMYQCNKWQESWLQDTQHGARANHSTVNALLRVSVFFEQAILDGVPAYGIAIDLSKAFDNVPIDIVFAICEKMGMNNGLWRAMRGMYKAIQRRFKIGSFVGEAFKDTNGILQGCPLSVMLLNALMAVLSSALKDKVQGESYVDDLTVLSPMKESVQQALDVIFDFMADTAQKVNLKKTKAFGTKNEDNFMYDGKAVEYVNKVKILGAVLRFTEERMNFTMEDTKVDAAVSLCNRIRYTPFPFHMRCLLVSSLVMSRVLYGSEILDMNASQERRLRTAVGYCIWKKSSKERSPGLLLTLTVKGHVADPAQAVHVRRLMALQRCVRAEPRLLPVLCKIWARLAPKRRLRKGGFVENLLYTVKRLNVSPITDDDGFFDYGIYFPTEGHMKAITDFTPSEWAHYARDIARKAVWKQIDKERQREGREVWGIGDGIDTDKTMEVYRKSEAKKQGVYRKFLLNAVWTQARRAKMPDNDDDPTCQCGMEDETPRHLWWRCPRWAYIRDKHLLNEYDYDALPVALRDLGILPAGYLAPVDTIQHMMFDIFVARFGSLPTV